MKKNLVVNNKTMMGLLSLVSFALSCKKLVEVPPNPPTEIAQAQQFGDSSATMAALAGAYSYTALTGSGFGYDDGVLVQTTGLSSDELLTTVTYDAAMLQYYTYGLNPLNNYALNLWSAPYTNLYQVNAILEGVTGNGKLSAGFRNQVAGEMKVLRALYYFNLVNLFGGVPLVTTTDYTKTTRIPRSSADSVYGQIITDLTDARQLLKAGYAGNGKHRPNLYAAETLLSRVYLYRGQWQQAYDNADAVIGSGDYNLVADPGQVFLEGSAEAIWQLPANSQNFVTSEAVNFVPYPGSIPGYPVSSFLLDAFETGDSRRQAWLGASTVGTDVYYYPYKYKNVQPTAPTTEDYMIFRLAELYLIRAEAAAHLGRGSDALADINTVRARAGLGGSTADPSSQTALLNAVMHERQVELFCEWGHRWYDLRRTGEAVTVLGAERTGFQAKDTLYPLPQSQLQLDNLLKQNPGY